jgi:NADH-quinone oxidoreductase subunit A
MNVYIPILVIGAIAAAFAVGSVGIALLIGPRRYNRAKQEAYECGIEPMAPGSPGHETTGQRFPVKYYLTAMLFIVFDIEIVFLYPWAVAFDSLGLFAVVEMLLFMLTVFVAYAYVWRRGGLSWD